MRSGKKIKIGILLCINIIFFSSFISAFAASIFTCKTLDSKSKTLLSGSAVELLDSSKNTIASGVTNETGVCSFSADIKEGTYFLKASKTDYKTVIVSRKCKPGKSYPINLYLKSSNHIPRIQSIIPKDKTSFLAGVKIKVIVKASDADQDPLEYRFSAGGMVVQEWASSSTFDWQTDNGNSGQVVFTCSVRDNKGGEAQKTATYDFLNPTNEEILGKVRDNYSQIKDFKSDAIFSTSLNSKKISGVSYCRLSFLVPYNEKMESFADEKRAQKTNILITRGGKISMINCSTGETRTIDLAGENNLSNDALLEKDVYYNTDKYIAANTLTRNDEFSRLDEKLIYIEATPKSDDESVGKTGMLVSYDKGIIVEMKMFDNEGNLMQIRKVLRDKQMPQGFWMPVKTEKIPVISMGTLQSTLTLLDPEVNIGLTENDFDPEKQQQ
ncbi:MAG: outer membrane lipoprotein-sorting protein [Candidatus Omnitrophica bacterium]|nr:outer membrane lipoprotein-sorting protein [Candidatus Omnitrophota bacterium]